MSYQSVTPEGPSAPIAASVLSVEGVTREFPGVVALDNVSLEVSRGEVHGVVGENGAGKSTLMAVISGALAPNAGTIHIDGELLDPITPNRAKQLGVAIVRQQPALLPDLTVAENLFLGVGVSRRPQIRELSSWTRRCLARWHPDATIEPDERIEQLFPEQQFTVEIAKALASEPRLLILDEPSEHLKRDDVERLFERVRELASAGTSVIYISHRIREVKAIAERITVLRDGKTRGTYNASDLSEAEIVNLVVGRKLEATFPPKSGADEAARSPRLELSHVRGPRFSDISFSVMPGEIVGLAGIEGNGQRETLRAIAGMTRSGGSVCVDGKRARVSNPQSAVRSGIAYLSGDRHREGIFADLSVADNVAFRSLGSIGRGPIVSDSAVLNFARDAVKDLNVRTPSLKTSIDLLSGGNQQKALIGGIMATPPKVLLVDEPTQGVDVGAKAEIYRILRKLAVESGTAIIALSSDALELAGLCDRVLVFSRGKVVADLAGERLSETAIMSAALTATTERDQRSRRASRFMRWLAGDTAPIAIVGLIIVLLALYTDHKASSYLSSFNIAATLTLIAPLMAAAMAQTAVMTTGGIDLSVGPMMGCLVAAESFLLQATNSFGSQLLGWILIPVAGIVIGLVNWSLVEHVRLPPLVATLVTYFALQAIGLILRPEPGGIFSTSIVNTLSAQIGPVPIVCIVLLALGLALQAALAWTRQGMSLRATGSDNAVSGVLGLKPNRARLIAYVGAGLLAAIGAVVLLAQVGDGDSTTGTNFTLLSISAAVVGGASVFGGRGSFVGAIIGAVLLEQVVGATTFLNLSTQWQSYLIGIMALVAVVVYSKARQKTRTAS